MLYKRFAFRIFSVFLPLFIFIQPAYQIQAQSIEINIPDSVYFHDEVIVWFRDGALNYDYLGCSGICAQGKDSKLLSLPIDTSFIYSAPLVNYLMNLGAVEIQSVFQELDPCRDTISISLNGDTLWTPHFWNVMRIVFSDSLNIPSIALGLTVLFPNSIVIAEPNHKVFYQGRKFPDKHLVNFPRWRTMWNPVDHFWRDNISLTDDQKGLWTYDYSGFPVSYGTNVETAWDGRERGNPDISVGIIDSGCDDHEDLKHPDGSSVVIKGGDFVASPIGSSYEDLSKQSYSHGTGVAGIVGAVTNNVIGIAGVAGGDGNVKGTSLKIFRIEDREDALCKSLVFGSLSKINSSQNEFRCNILNCSNGIMGHSYVIMASTAFAYANGIITTVCMMNQGQEHFSNGYYIYPADVDSSWVIAVGGSKLDVSEVERHPYSDYGHYIDFLAPISAYTTTSKYGNKPDPNNYHALDGTSFSTPIVAGITSLLLSREKEIQASSDPDVYKRLPLKVDGTPDNLTNEDIEWLLKLSCLDVVYDDGRPVDLGKDKYSGFGLVKADQAMKFMESPYRIYHFDESVNLLEQLPTPTSYHDIPISFPGIYSSAIYQQSLYKDSLYEVDEYKIRKTIRFPKTIPSLHAAWGRGDKTTGCHLPDLIPSINPPQRFPLFRVGYCNTLGWNDGSDKWVDLETSLFKVGRRNQPKSDWQWLPVEPERFRFSYTVISREEILHVSSPKSPESNSFFIYDLAPNPVYSNFKFRLHSLYHNNSRVKVIDVLGRDVKIKYHIKNISDEDVEYIISFDNINNGNYFVLVQSGNSFAINKFVVMK